MTFAPVGGKSQENGKPVGVIWHEAIMGRNDEDVTSTYAKYIEYMRDKTRFLFWVDNCSSRNKNWTLYTTFCFLVNSPDYSCKEIIVKYFEPGHTFMAADAFHKQNEDGMKERKNEYDFPDFSSIMNFKGIAVEMEVSDFKEYESKLSKAKCTNYPLLENVVVVRFVHGSEKMYWKENMDVTDFKSGYFLQNKFVQAMMKRNSFLQRTSDNGFHSKKNNELVKKLCPLMKENRISFWENHPVSNDS